MVRVGVIRCFSEAEGSTVEAVSDLRPDRLAAIRKLYSSVQTTRSAEDLIANPRIDAVAVATPVSTHYDLVLRALQAGKHVLLEKPMTTSTQSSMRLIEEAARRKLVLMVDHTFVYAGAVRKIRQLIADGELGQLYYYDAVRVNLGLFQHDVDVIWDLAVHDISIMDHVLRLRPVAVSATGLSHIPGGKEDIAYLTIFCEDNLIAHVHANWLAPVKVRRTMIGGSRQMIVYDDVEPSEKVKVYDRGIAVKESPESVLQMMINYRVGDVWVPRLDTAEALKVEAAEFIASIQQAKTPLTDGWAGLRTVQILEMATRSMQEKGRLIEFQAMDGAAA
jgi:predicted dehydrogenase